MEKINEPGSARFGNFINYYDFNPTARRLQLVPRDLITPIVSSGVTSLHVLDVGCNAGNLTEALYDHLTPSLPDHCTLRILGVDLDATLIQRCRENSKHTQSINYLQADVITEAGLDKVNDYLTQHNATSFHLVTCFSVTMWVHLNHGDSVFRTFLSHSLAGELCGQLLLLEPQPWQCYKNARSRMRKLQCAPFERYDTLEWRENVAQEIERYLVQNCGMLLRDKYGLTEGWKRPLCLFEKDKT